MKRLRTSPVPAGTWILLMGLSCACIAHAQQDPLKGIGDPTRPPSGVMGKQAAAAAPAASGASSPDVELEKPKPVELTLQAIRYDVVNGQAVAMVNDELVEVGDKVEGMSVISISRNVVVLKGPAGVRRLALLLASHEMDPRSESGKGGTAKRGRKESK